MYGDYPETMKKNVGSRLPSFNGVESRLVKGSADFLGINFYFAAKVKDSPWSLDINPRDYKTDMAVELDCMPRHIGVFLDFAYLCLAIISVKKLYLTTLFSFLSFMAVALKNVTEVEVGAFPPRNYSIFPCFIRYFYGKLNLTDRFSFLSSVSGYSMGFARHAGIFQAEVWKPANLHS